MKICFLVYRLQSGGAERTVSYLASYMARKGWDVTLLNSSKPKDIFYTLDPKVRVVCLNHNTEDGGKLRNKFNALLRNGAIRRYINRNTPDCLFCMMPFSAKYILDVACRDRFKLITSERNNPAMIYAADEIETRDRIFENSDGIVFQTERARQYYPPEIQKKGQVIYNAVGNEYIQQCPYPPVTRENKITAIGRLEDQKDYPTMLRAFQKVLKACPGVILNIFGQGEDRPELEKMIIDQKLNDSVFLKGVDKKAIVSAASGSCFVMSSKFEGMPNALMEAMAVGLPCVSTDCPNGPAELIENEKSGLLVPVGDEDALASAMIRMLKDREFAESCGREARKILKRQSVDKISEEYCSFIEKVCGG